MVASFHDSAAKAYGSLDPLSVTHEQHLTIHPQAAQLVPAEPKRFFIAAGTGSYG